ncbi:ribonuclease HII [Acuticoccus sp. MNP-M23]|uniref:ribonuclease HII n=1 Tax=Acuticoccus sp. MNP-M23 TaxID=3072793 RepID=UPI00281660BE|nr:ribonuclease HII [Acuticoccus sp. MNP-M23]WMS41289.1 ribonuclease HII [Acuticoccus sp. MNP-M23]
MERPSRYRQIVCGVDEAGRGPWAGPVVVAAVILDRASPIHGLDDSKKLSAHRREVLFGEIMASSWVAVATVGCDRIEAMNIRGATLHGMTLAIGGLALRPTLALIDGNALPPGCPVKARALVGGDGRSASIAAASIVAKVTRDRLMVRLARACPGYGFEAHKGYGTARHREALDRLGPSIHHRRGFAPIRAALAARLQAAL